MCWTFQQVVVPPEHVNCLHFLHKQMGLSEKWVYLQIVPYAPWCWNIYQHLPHKSPSFVGKYTSTMVHLEVIFIFIAIISPPWEQPDLNADHHLNYKMCDASRQWNIYPLTCFYLDKKVVKQKKYGMLFSNKTIYKMVIVTNNHDI
jgi:hypothetical protein